MTICGLQKLTLLDYPGHVAATVFTRGCNFRCPFCHNSSLVLAPEEAQEIPENELNSFFRKRTGILDGICVSGGEPLLHETIGDFLRQIKSFGYRVKLDTNGSYPDRLIQLIREGLVDYVAMDLKNCLSRYDETIGIPGYDTAAIEKSADFLRSDENPVPYEFRTTVVREFHDINSFAEIAKRFPGIQNYYLQQFVDSETVISGGLHSYDKSDLLTFSNALGSTVQNVGIRGI